MTDNTPENKPDPMLGRFLLNQFKIIRKLGQGGFGAVYEALQPSLDRKVAIKVLHPNLTQNPEVITRFRREGLIATRLKHPSTIEVFTLGQTDDGYLWLAMEFVEGETLESYLRRNQTITPQELFEIIAPVCEVLAEAHDKGIIHRDLKPDNIMLSVASGKRTSKVLDFGISSLRGADSATHASEVSGTPQFMAPEQWDGLAMVDARSDIYSLGVVLYRALSNQLPFDADSPLAWMKKHHFEAPLELATIANHLPEALCQVVMRAISKQPERRQQSARQLKEELSAAIQGAPSRSPSMTQHKPPLRARIQVDNTNDKLLSIARFGAEIFAVGENGIILRNHNETLWSLVESPVKVALQCIHAYPHGLCAVGAGGVILCSREGTRWESRASRTRVTLFGAWGDAHGLFVVGQLGVVLRSTDQGMSFHPLRVGCRDHLYAVWGVTEGGRTTLWIAGADGALLRSIDRGESWQKITLPASVDIIALHGRSASEIYLGTKTGHLLSSLDGERFSVEEIQLGDPLRQVYCRADGVIEILSKKRCHHKINDKKSNTPLPREYLGMLVEDDSYFFCGENNEIIRMQDTGDSDGSRLCRPLYRGTFPHLRSAMEGPDVIVLCGNSGTFSTSRNGGTIWSTEQLTGYPDVLCAHRPRGDKYYYTVGHEKHFAVIEEEVARWDLFTPANLSFVWSSAPDDVYAIGELGTILHTSNSGGEFDIRESGVRSTLHSMWGRDPNALYIVGADGVILRSQDHGYQWELLESNTRKALHCIWGFGEGELLICGEDGLLLYSNDDGATWQKRQSGTKETLTNISGGDDDLILCGTNGTLLHSQDRGLVWRAWSTFTAEHLSGAIRTTKGLVVYGSHGLVLYFEAEQGQAQPIDSEDTIASV